MPYDAVFDANSVPPQQGGGRHPPGNKYPFEVTSTVVTPTKDNKGGMFVVELSSPAGSIKNNYNLWNENDKAREIAQKQLSALCHAVGRFQVDFKNDGAALRGGRGLMDIGFQSGHEPSAEKPEGGYVEVKKVYDSAGNEPGKANVTQQPHGQQQAVQHQQAVQAAQPNGGWGGQPSQQTAQGSHQPNSNQGGWSQGPSGNNPPWKT